MTTKGSCRFKPYFKAQLWVPRFSAWQDIQRAFTTEAGPLQEIPYGARYRIVCVTEQGRTFSEPRIKVDRSTK